MLTVEDIMTPTPLTVTPETSLGEVLRLMKENNCRQLPVMQEGELVGIITDRDLRLAMNSPFILHERADDQSLLEHIPASACMTPDPLVISSDASAAKAADLMRVYKFGGLPVLKDKKVIGIITVTDLLSSYIQLLEAQNAD